MEILAFIISCVNLVLVIVAILKYKKLKDFVIADTVSRNEWDTERNEISNRITGINGRMNAFDKKFKELDDRSLYYDDSISELRHDHEAVSSKMFSLKRDYDKALTGINDLYSIVDSIRMRMYGAIDANDRLGQENKKLKASTEDEEPSESLHDTNLRPFGPRDNDKVVNVINNIHTSPTFYSKEEIEEHVNKMNEAVDKSDSDQKLPPNSYSQIGGFGHDC